MRARQPFVEHGHAGNRGARVLVEHERVPRGEERARQGGDHHGVVDVGEDAESRRRVDDEDGGGDGSGAVDAQRELVPSRFEFRFDAGVDHAAAVRVDDVRAAPDLDGDGCIHHRDAEEAAPAAHLLGALGGGGIRRSAARPGRARAPRSWSRSPCTERSSARVRACGHGVRASGGRRPRCVRRGEGAALARRRWTCFQCSMHRWGQPARCTRRDGRAAYATGSSSSGPLFLTLPTSRPTS